MEDLIQDLNYINELKNQAYEKCYQILGEAPAFFNPYWAVRIINHECNTEFTVEDVQIINDCLEYCEALIGNEYHVYFDYKTGNYGPNAPESGDEGGGGGQAL